MINPEKHILDGTLNKWDILRNQDEHIDLYALEAAMPCACCTTYKQGNCDNCPIAIYTGMDNCIGTPYVDWIKNKYSAIRYIAPKDIAQREYEFLVEVRNWISDE